MIENSITWLFVAVVVSIVLAVLSVVVNDWREKQNKKLEEACRERIGQFWPHP